MPRTIAADLDLGAAVIGMGIIGWSADGKNLYVRGTTGIIVTINAVPVDGSAHRELFRYGNIGTIPEKTSARPFSCGFQLDCDVSIFVPVARRRV